jgi:hypothetical protein
MQEEVTVQHVALQYKSKEKADVFFKEILGLNLIKDFKLSKDLSKKIFDISEEVNVFVYGNKESIFEIFITSNKTEYVFNHICIKISDKDNFIKTCEKNNLKPFFVEKKDKNLLFVKDHSDNLYEIK